MVVPGMVELYRLHRSYVTHQLPTSIGMMNVISYTVCLIHIGQAENSIVDGKPSALWGKLEDPCIRTKDLKIIIAVLQVHHPAMFISDSSESIPVIYTLRACVLSPICPTVLGVFLDDMFIGYNTADSLVGPECCVSHECS